MDEMDNVDETDEANEVSNEGVMCVAWELWAPAAKTNR